MLELASTISRVFSDLELSADEHFHFPLKTLIRRSDDRRQAEKEKSQKEWSRDDQLSGKSRFHRYIL